MEDYKEKYEKALKRAKEYTKNSTSTDPKTDYANDILKNIFPELKESEDERIRKECIAAVKTAYADGENRQKCIAWLEKQGEQKPAWSEQDSKIINNVITFIEDGALYKEEKDFYIERLKSIKERYAWKPCDYELEVLRLAAEKDGTCLMGLYEQLKKLKG